MKVWITLLLILPFGLSAQDFTIHENQNAETTKQGESTLIVVPYHPHYLISELDRAMANDVMDVNTMRSALRRKMNRAITQSLSDSIDALDFSLMQSNLLDLEEYTYSSVNFHFEAMPLKGKKKKGLLSKLPKKKERVFGQNTERTNGQIQQSNIYEDRYMAVEFSDEGAVSYLQDLYSFQYILFVTQLELRRNLSDQSSLPYIATLHYQLMDAKGSKIAGSKVSRYLSTEEVSIDSVCTYLSEEFSKEIFNSTWNQDKPSTVLSTDNSDY